MTVAIVTPLHAAAPGGLPTVQYKLKSLGDWAYVYREGVTKVNTNYGTNSGKSEGVVWKKMPQGNPEGNQTFLRGNFFLPENPFGPSTVFQTFELS